MKVLSSFGALVLAVLVALGRQAPQDSFAGKQSAVAASPEMKRLAKVLTGDWDTVENMARSQFFPDGGSRRGTVHAQLASGGYTLVYEVHSNGSAGKLEGFHTIWWDKNTKLYYFFACFNNPNSPCRMRGTAHWEGASLVNDYEFTVNGKKTPCRDTFTFTPTSHTLVAAMDTGDGTMKTLITTTATRR
jgi:hypothetical protein